MTASTNAAWAAFLLRLGLGAMFLSHGLVLKVMTFGMAGTTAYFVSLGYPAALAWAVTLAEIAGGVLLILGVATRATALALLPVLFGAASVHWGNGWVFTAPNGGWEYPVFLALAAVVQALLGEGAWALRLPSPARPFVALQTEGD